MQEVCDSLTKVTEKRIIQGILMKLRTVEDVMLFTEDVNMNIILVRKEYIRLKNFSETFLGRYATEYNKCFEDTSVPCRQIQSTLKSIREVFEKTSPRGLHLPPSGEKLNVMDTTPLTADCYQLSFLDITDYDKSVEALYAAIIELLSLSMKVLDLCTEMMNIEAETRKDFSVVNDIFQNTYDSTLSRCRSLITAELSTNSLPYNQMVEDWKKMTPGNRPKMITDGYHKYPTDTMDGYVIHQAISQARAGGLVGEEVVHFNNRPEKAVEVRISIEHFDLIIGMTDKIAKISTDKILEWIKWCEVPKKDEKRLYEKTFDPIYKEKGGRHDLPKWDAIDKRRKLLGKFGATDKHMAENFQSLYDTFIEANPNLS